MKLDLHGKTIHEAWRTFKEHTEICRLNGIRKFVVVTGYGKIYEELPRWTDSISCIRGKKPMVQLWLLSNSAKKTKKRL